MGLPGFEPGQLSLNKSGSQCILFTIYANRRFNNQKTERKDNAHR